MESRHLMQLAAILDHGGVNAAANEMGITQPTMTRNMQTLEMQAGGKLFSRSRHGVVPTPLGEALAREGRAIAKAVWSARQASIRNELGMVREWRIGAGPLLSNVLMHRVVERIQTVHPNLSILVRVDTPYRLIEQMQNQELDVVVAPHVVAGSVGVQREFLHPDALGVFTGRSHPLAVNGGVVSVSDLNGHSWINLGTYARFNESPAERLQRLGVRDFTTPIALAGDTMICLNLLRAGQHLCLMPRTLMQWIKHAYDLVELEVDSELGERDLYLWYPTENPVEPAVNLIRETMQGLLGGSSG